MNLGTGTGGNIILGNGTSTINVPKLAASSGVYTDPLKNLTSTPPTSGTMGFWNRNSGTATLSPTTIGDAVTTSGNIYTTIGGTITSAGLLTGSAGATITGATTISGGVVDINNSSNNATNINTGTSFGAVTIGNSLSSLYLPKFTTAGILHNDATGLVT